MVKPFIFQVVGYQNRGKTTFIDRAIQSLHQQGLETAVLKHHGHGGEPDVEETKDSAKHFRAGASASLVEGAGTIEMIGRIKDTQPLNNLLKLLETFFTPDVILIEGYKKESYPKVVLIKEPSDLQLIKELPNVKAAAVWPQCLKEAEQALLLPVFPIDSSGFHEWLFEQIASKE